MSFEARVGRFLRAAFARGKLRGKMHAVSRASSFIANGVTTHDVTTLTLQRYYKELSGARCSLSALSRPHSLSPFRHSHREIASSTCQNFVRAEARLSATDKPQLATHARRHSPANCECRRLTRYSRRPLKSSASYTDPSVAEGDANDFGDFVKSILPYARNFRAKNSEQLPHAIQRDAASGRR